MSEPKELSRRGALMKLGILINGGIAALLAVPIVGYILSPLKAAPEETAWVPLGPVSQFPEGPTRLATFRNPSESPSDGRETYLKEYEELTRKDGVPFVP